MSRVLKDGSNQITQGYSRKHQAVDLVKYKNRLDTVIAHSDGKIVFWQTGYKNDKGSTGNASYGNCVKIEHKDGYYTLYAHLKDVYVKKEEIVHQGQELGYMGDSGNAYGPHLHFEVWKENQRIDPTPYLNANLPDQGNYPEKINAEYRVYDNVKKTWLPIVENTNDYAGNLKHNIGGFQVVTTGGGITKIRAHVLGGSWLDEVTDGAFKTGNNDYAGMKGKPIDAIMIWSQYGDAVYRVHTKKGGWLPWVTGYDINDFQNGYAGNFGEAIDAMECYIK